MNKISKTEILQKVIETIEEMTEDWGIEPESGITEQTMLVRDMEFASVDIIQLCVAIEQRFNKKMGFQDMLMVDGIYVSDLSIDDIAGFIESKIKES